jgi:hypothetical protein
MGKFPYGNSSLFSVSAYLAAANLHRYQTHVSLGNASFSPGNGSVLSPTIVRISGHTEYVHQMID